MGHREDLLAGARRCLQERGYAHTTARDLVAASGTNLASIGYHFGSKEALLNEALSLSFSEWADRILTLALASVPQPDSDGTDGSARLLAASLDAMLASFPEYRALGVAFVEAWAQAERQPELRSQLAATYRRSRAQATATVSELLPQLSARHADAIAAFEIAICDGLLIQWLLDPTSPPSGDDLVAALSALLTRPS